VTRAWRILVVALGAQAGTAAVAAAMPSCAACRLPGIPWAILGALSYAGLLALSLWRGPSRTVNAACVAAAGVHAGLVARMAVSGPWCGVCLSLAAGSLILAGLAVALDRRLLLRAGALAPWAALVAWTLSAPPPIHPAAGGDAVRVVVFMQDDCRYCEEFRSRMAPDLSREFGGRLDLEYRAAKDVPGVRRTPTFLISPASTAGSSRVIEGLPTMDALRTAIRAAGGRS
jgi:hypothetical protein